jgi:PKD repeat protein
MILKIDMEKSTIEQSINAIPSVDVEVNECNRQTNYRCQVGFISNVRDESKKVTYHWDFGDGESSVRKNPLHTYQKLGGYKVTLHVTDEKGATNSVSTDVNVLKYKKAVQRKKPIAHMPATNAVEGEAIRAYIAKNGPPAESLIKKNASINAYRYGNIWLLAKYDKIKCAVLDGGLGMTLMGYPKQCYWHEKNAANYMIDLQ